MTSKEEGFIGQRSFVLTKAVEKLCKKNEIISSLFITHIGYFPKAKGHMCIRDIGAKDQIALYCTIGKGFVNIGTKKLKITAGTFVIIPADTPHQYGADAKDPWTIYWFHFTGTGCRKLVEIYAFRNAKLQSLVAYDNRLVHTFDTIFDLLSMEFQISNIIYANMTFYGLLSSLIFHSQQNRHRSSMGNFNLMDKATEFMKLNIDKSLSLNEMAESVHLSPTYFSGYFKAHTGFAPLAYFNHMKIKRTCEYLSFTDMRVKEIAKEVGIYDAYYFSRLFKKIMKISPLEYRGRHINKAI